MIPQSRSPHALLSINRGWAMYAGPVTQNRPHQHYAHQIAWSLETDIEAVGTQGSVCGAGYFVCSTTVHCVKTSAWLQTVYLTPEMVGAQWFSERAGGSLAVMSVHEARQLGSILSKRLRPGASDNDVLERSNSVNYDERLVAVLKHLEQGLHQPLRAIELAKFVHLSPSRFLHWFSDSLGLPFRAYVRWLRLQVAVRALADGANLTQAAHFSGFADSAHLSRTFVSAFGITPNSLATVEITISDLEFPMSQIVQALDSKSTEKTAETVAGLFKR